MPSDPSSPSGRDSRKAYLLLAFAALCWSGNHIAARASAGQVPPFGMATLRWLLPVLLLTPVTWPNLRRDWPVIRGSWRSLLFLGLTGGAVFSALQYLGLQFTTALNVSLFNSLSPVLIAVVSALIFRDRLTARQTLGVATSFAGVLAIISQLDLETLRHLKFNAGDLIILFNMGVFGVYSACLRLQPPMHWLSLTYVVGAISTISTAPLFAWEHMAGQRFQTTPLAIFAVAYMAIFPSVVAFLCWNRGVRLIGANRSGPFLHLVPLYSAVLATTLLGESLRAYHIVGFLLIIAGVFIASRRT